MKRRFLLGSIGALILSLRSFALSQLEGQETSVNKVLLNPGSDFVLPSNPQNGTKIVFVPQGDLEKKPAVLRNSHHKIMGQVDDMEIDMNVQFTLVFLNRETGWALI